MKLFSAMLLCFLVVPAVAQQPKESPKPSQIKSAEPTKAAPPKAAPPKAAPTETAQPKTEHPKAAHPKAAHPKAAQPKAAQPKAAQPAAGQPKAVQPNVVQPKAVPPALPEPRHIEKPESESPDTAHHRHQRPNLEHPPATTKPAVASAVDETPVVTHHTITVDGKPLQYTATAAQMPIKNTRDETEAHIFYVAYTLDGVADRSKRPLTFAFNGGPGSASIWVHMGAMGPRSPKLMDNGDMPSPPFKLIDNPFTWLDQTDLVFIDPVGTGYSRAKTPEIAHQLNGVRGDIQSVGAFIRMYITRNERWGSPLFIAGESYGTFGAAGLAGTLIEKGIAVNGIVLISTVLNMGILDEDEFFGLPYALHLPTCTADAWYHKKLPADLQKKDLKSVLKESEHWAMTDYVSILDKGSSLTPGERKSAIAKLARYTGLDPHYIDDCDLRVDAGRFDRQLLHDKKLVIGGYDGRLTGPAPLSINQCASFDPSGSLIRPPFESTFQQYIRGELNYKTDMVYNVLGGISSWDWEATNGYAETTGLLRNAFTKNPHLKVMVCAGYFDNVTPYFSVQYTFNHLGLHPEMLKNVRWDYYEAGHMMYIDRASHRKLKHDITDFIKSATPAS